MGDKKTGKTSLINKLFEIQTAGDVIKETVALEYRNGSRKLDDQKIKVNCYELGGGRILSNILQAPLTGKNIPEIASLCICIDLSKPGNIVDSLLFWIAAAKEYGRNGVKDLQSKNLEAYNMYRKEASDYWNNVPAASEKNNIDISFIPITVICTKYDLFANSK